MPWYVESWFISKLIHFIKWVALCVGESTFNPCHPEASSFEAVRISFLKITELEKMRFSRHPIRDIGFLRMTDWLDEIAKSQRSSEFFIFFSQYKKHIHNTVCILNTTWLHNSYIQQKPLLLYFQHFFPKMLFVLLSEE